jgi:hypothetical protein
VDPDRDLPIPSSRGGEEAVNLGRGRGRRRGRRGWMQRLQGGAGGDDAGVLEERRERGLKEAGGGEVEAVASEAGRRGTGAPTGPPAIGRAPRRWVHSRRERPRGNSCKPAAQGNADAEGDPWNGRFERSYPSLGLVCLLLGLFWSCTVAAVTVNPVFSFSSNNVPSLGSLFCLVFMFDLFEV